jgi:hypothetical protein
MSKPWKRTETVSAEFSPCRKYRYWLLVRWWIGPTLVVCALNPSTADEDRDDPTVRKCINWAKRNGYGAILMLNCYAFRATSPKVMMAESDPFGTQTPEMLVTLFKVAGAGAIAIAAWGGGGQHLNRGDAVAAAFKSAGIRLHCWGKNQDATPLHPCYASLGKIHEWAAPGTPQ